MRLSVEDTLTDSLSIPNQRLILREKAMSLPEYENGELMEFIDNGHTGMNFERPAIQELLTLVQSGKVDCIIVKDFSRFGRNSIETGYFIERVFPLYHTRFISVSDDFDSQNYKGDTGGIEVAFRYLISECYSRDMSIKTRSAKYAKMRRGEYQSVICPYGYRKSADGRMEPDEETADVVRKIFILASQGVSAAGISRKLYEEKIPTPGEHKAAKGKQYHDVSRSNGVWPSSTILRMLRDERYIGTYIIGKREVKEIGGTRMRLKDEDKWIKISDHHEAIIGQKLFETANSMIHGYSISNRQQHCYPLKGKVICGYCDHAMARKGTGNNVMYYCRHSKVSNTLLCNGLQIRAVELEQAVLDTIRAQMCPVLGVDTDTDALDLQTMQQSEINKEIQLLQNQKRQLYEQYVSEQIDLAAYKAQKEQIDAKLVKAKNTYASISSKAKQAQTDYEKEQKRQSVAQEIFEATGLTQQLSDRIINRVYIFKDNRIEVDYTIKDLFPF